MSKGKMLASAKVIHTMLMEGKAVCYVGADPRRIIDIIKEVYGVSVRCDFLPKPSENAFHPDLYVEERTPIYRLFLVEHGDLQGCIDRIKNVGFDSERLSMETRRFIEKRIMVHTLFDLTERTGNLPFQSIH